MEKQTLHTVYETFTADTMTSDRDATLEGIFCGILDPARLEKKKVDNGALYW